MKHYYVSYLFKPNNNELGQWGFGSANLELKDLSIKDIKQFLDERNNFECTIINVIEISKEEYDKAV